MIKSPGRSIGLRVLLIGLLISTCMTAFAQKKLSEIGFSEFNDMPGEERRPVYMTEIYDLLRQNPDLPGDCRVSHLTQGDLRHHLSLNLEIQEPSGSITSFVLSGIPHNVDDISGVYPIRSGTVLNVMNGFVYQEFRKPFSFRAPASFDKFVKETLGMQYYTKGWEFKIQYNRNREIVLVSVGDIEWSAKDKKFIRSNNTLICEDPKKEEAIAEGLPEIKYALENFKLPGNCEVSKLVLDNTSSEPTLSIQISQDSDSKSILLLDKGHNNPNFNLCPGYGRFFPTRLFERLYTYYGRYLPEDAETVETWNPDLAERLRGETILDEKKKSPMSGVRFEIYITGDEITYLEITDTYRNDPESTLWWSIEGRKFICSSWRS